MDNNIKKQNAFISEEEKTLIWEDVQSAFKKNFGNEIYNSWKAAIQQFNKYQDFADYGYIKGRLLSL